MSSASVKDVEVDDKVSITSEDNAVTQFEAPKEFLQEVRTLVEQLRNCESDPTKGFSQQEKLQKYYWDKKLRHYRKQVGDVLSECGFPACACKMLENLQLQGYFAEGFDKITSPYLWKTSRCVLDNAWNYSNASAEFAKDLANYRTLQIMCWNMEHYPDKKPDVKSKQYFIMKATLCILNNIARRPENKHIFKKHKVVKLVFEFKFSHNNYLKVLALTTLACMVDANEAMKLTQDKDTIQTIIHWMNLSIEVDEYHRLKEEFTAAELAYALDKLAIAGNAESIVEGNALKALCRMLNTADMEQQVNAAKCIWTLAFNSEAKKAIKTYTQLIATLYRLEKEERNRELLENVKGALWVLFEKVHAEPPDVDPTKPKHIFISYCWNEKEAVRKIWQKLKAEGYNVLIDIDRMSGDILEDMSSAVESSSIVILCISEGYKQSQRCRVEAGYCYKRKKGFIPLLMQTPFDADGWLGAMLGTHLYFDFSCNSEVEFDNSMRNLLKELTVQGVTYAGSESPMSPEIPKDGDVEKTSGAAIAQRPITISACCF